MAGQLPMMEKEGSEKVTTYNRLKLDAEDGKKRVNALLNYKEKVTS